MKILITGGTGVIGSQVVKQLAEMNEEIVLIGRREVNPHPPEISEHVKFISFSEIENYLEQIVSDEPFALIHLAYDKILIDENFTMLSRLIDVIKSSSVKIKKMVFASTIDVYGNKNRGCVSSFIHSEKPVSCYGKIKKRLEDMVIDELGNELELEILRIGIVKGEETWWDEYLAFNSRYKKIGLPNGGENIVNVIDKTVLAHEIVNFAKLTGNVGHRIFNIGQSDTWANLYLSYNPDAQIFDSTADLGFKEKLKFVIMTNCFLNWLVGKIKAEEAKTIHQSNKVVELPDISEVENKPANNANVFAIHNSSINYEC